MCVQQCLRTHTPFTLTPTPTPHIHTHSHAYTHTHMNTLTLTHIHTQLHNLSVDGSLTVSHVSDPPILLYLKKQMEDGMSLQQLEHCIWNYMTHVHVASYPSLPTQLFFCNRGSKHHVTSAMSDAMRMNEVTLPKVHVKIHLTLSTFHKVQKRELKAILR